MTTDPLNALEIVLQQVENLLEPVIAAAEGPAQRDLLFLDLGWDINALTGLPMQQLDTALSSLPPLIDGLTNGLDVSDLGAILDAFQASGELVGSIDDFEAAFKNGLPAVPVDALAVDLLNYLVVGYVARGFPRVFAFLRIATLIDLPDVPANPRAVVRAQDGRLIFDGKPRLVMRFDRLPELLTDPAKLFKKVYWPQGFGTQAAADAAADRLFPRLEALIVAFGGEATYGKDIATGISYGTVVDDSVAHMLTIRQPLPTIVTEDGEVIRESVSLTAGFVAPEPPTVPDAGVVLLPSGEASAVGKFGSWLAEVDVDATGPAFLVTKSGVETSATSVDVKTQLTVTKLPGESGAAVLIGSWEGTHFAIGTITMTGGADFTLQEVTPNLGFDLIDAELVVKAGDGDGFLKMILPPEGFRVPIDFGIAWSPKTGIVFHGGATLEVELPINLDLTIIKIPSIFLSLGVGIKPNEPPKAALAVATTVDLEIGPVFGTVEQMGVIFNFAFPEKGGNLGPVDLSIGFKPPKGVGMSVKAGPVEGGGYLFLDYDKGEYGGILHLDIAGKISVTAIGLLNTKWPDGREGYSLVVLICAEFSPIQLSYGFTLNGLGGIVGINRSMNVPALQDGIRRGALGSMLFPVDPVPRARQIITDIGTIFPPTEGQFIVGPMVKIGWGASVITGTLAVIIQIPALRIALLGRLQIALPPDSEEEAIVILRIDFGGIIDIPGKAISFDGTFEGSKVAIFTLTGDIALRLNFGEQPNFALAAGGFYPNYPAPSDFPNLRRLALQLANSDNPRLRIEAYFAFTPATLQFGGRAEFYYGVDTGALGFFEVDAGAAFDVIITFPSTFVASFNVHVLLRRNHQAFMGVEIDVRLNGAQPLVLDGKATFHFLGDHDLPFHKSIGDEPPAANLEPVNAAETVRRALADPSAWSAEPPTGAAFVRTLVSEGDNGLTYVHPWGGLAIHQKAAPLYVELAKFGEAAVAGPTQLEVTHIKAFGAELPTTGMPVVKEHFAPSQFFNLTKQQRVTQPAFERMQAGVDAAAAQVEYGGIVPMEFGYDDIEIPADPKKPSIAHGVHSITAQHAGWTVAGGPAAFKGAAAKPAARFAGEPLGIDLREDDAWGVVHVGGQTTGGKVQVVKSFGTAAEAFSAAGEQGSTAAPMLEAIA
jgi:hypothetical protein